MQAGIAHYGRTFLAALTAALMVFSLMSVFADTADANHVSTVPASAESNDPAWWEDWGFDNEGQDDWSCTKTDNSNDDGTPYELGKPPSGEFWRLLVVKAGNDHSDLYWNPHPGKKYAATGQGAGGWSHVILCSRPIPDETTTTTTAPTTTTTAPTTTTTAPTTTTTAPPEVGQIIVEKVVAGESSTFEFTFETVGFTLTDYTLAHGQSSSSGDVAVGDGYAVSEVVPNGWNLDSATCDDGSPITNIDVAAGETVTCTFTNTISSEVQAAILVQVGGTCVENDGEGEGVIDVNISVDEGAEVVVHDSDGDVVATFTSDGSVTVPEGATYTWQATPNEGFEFPEGAAASGTITIETCSDEPVTTTTTIQDEVLSEEVLPFTGIDLGTMVAYAAALIAAGAAMLLTMRKTEAS